MHHYGVTALGKGTAIPFELCLVLAHWGGSEPINTMLTDH